MRQVFGISPWVLDWDPGPAERASGILPEPPAHASHAEDVVAWREPYWAVDVHVGHEVEVFVFLMADDAGSVLGSSGVWNRRQARVYDRVGE